MEPITARRRERAKAKTQERQAMREPDITPGFPTSGQAIGFFIKSLDFPHKRLRTKTASRYFSGSIDSIVLEKSRTMIFDAVAEVLIQVGVFPLGDDDDEKESVSSMADAIRIQAGYWDEFRSKIRPRLTPVNPENLAKIYAAYARLASIDLALRVGALWHATGFAMPKDGLEVEWIDRDTRGKYLNRKREEAGLTVERFVELTGVSRNSVAAWLYNGARPSDKNIVKIASALTRNDKSASRNALANEIRRFYWFADVAELVSGLIGTGAAKDLAIHLCQYVEWTAMLILSLRLEAEDNPDWESEIPAMILDLYLYGSRSKYRTYFLESIAEIETDAEWKLDIEAAGGDWMRRILLTVLNVHNEEVDESIESYGGSLPPSWGASDPQAYYHYRNSLNLSTRGKWDEAIAEVEKAARLDPNDPVNHYTLASVLSDRAYRTGDESMMNRAMDEGWLAFRLDPTRILTWTEIGWMHILSGRHREARDHLLNVRDDCGPLDTNYYQALGIAYQELGEQDEALAAFESGLALEPNYKWALVGAFQTASALGDEKRRRKYTKALKHIGVDDSEISLLSK